MRLKNIPDPIFHHIFDDKFECALDYTGIIWIKYPDGDFERPCMKCCYDVIKTRNILIAKFILSKSCDIQNNDSITQRAARYS